MDFKVVRPLATVVVQKPLPCVLRVCFPVDQAIDPVLID